MSDILTELQWRGLIHQSTDDGGLAEFMAQPRTVYAGFDPTADSLHVGSLLPLMMLRRFQLQGHRPIALVGGATGMVGDPSGKSQERNLLSLDELQRNIDGMREQLKLLLDFDAGERSALVLNNYDWLQTFSYLEFLRDVGKHISVNVMNAKDSVKGRLDREDGLSYTEFSYMLLQGYDFVHLNRSHHCEVQIGGSDQWGNITLGIDLARRMHRVKLHGLTCPLLTKSDGGKMGKTESGTIWLSAEKTSHHAFYQYWFNVDDADVSKCLRFLTELTEEEITALDESRAAAPNERRSQIRLADELTRMIRGDDGLATAHMAKEFFFGAEIKNVTDSLVTDVFPEVPSCELPRERLAAGLPIVDAFVAAGLGKSKGEARRLIKQGGAYVNNSRVDDSDLALTTEHLASESVIVLRSGRKKYALLRFV
ncbi:MAG: tyrosine--tRNA ligase [Pirellulaceae bacterium]|jgi:tyrosyl-tRNA synthetase|nr:tyrosine--tRNA ligase [Pirellulaceae bacterium]